MELTEGQKKGVQIACERFRQREPYTVIAGYAGTGKTTLIQYIIEELNIPELQVVYIAYTGKASLVLKNKGCENSMTAHKLLYNAHLEDDGSYTFTPKASIGDYKIIVCDEVSMMPQEMIDQLLSYHIYVLFLGDIGQLPPVEGKQTILDNPHIILDEITRQAEGNPIITAATLVRNNYVLQLGGNKQCRVILKDMVSSKLLLGADQILVGKNATRIALNDSIRTQLYGPDCMAAPLDGEKVICLHNRWDTSSKNGEPLLNGQIGVLIHPRVMTEKGRGKFVLADFVTDDGYVFKNLKIDYSLLMHNELSQQAKKLRGKKRSYEFAFGYAITVHKSQGSEFSKVLVYDEWLGDYEYHKRWLYTACTRAVDQLVIAR